MGIMPAARASSLVASYDVEQHCHEGQHDPDPQSAIYPVEPITFQTLTAAMLDRLLHHAHIAQINGEN